MPGRISNLTGHEILVKMGGNSLRLHLYACLIELGIIPVIYTQFDQKFMPGRIGSKSIEITLPIKGHTIPVNFNPI